jgi:two-component system nitrogen regulation sensor histidine kinase GlnL
VPDAAVLLEHLPEGVLLLQEGRVVFATERAAELLALSRRRLLGAALTEALPAAASEVADRVLAGASSCAARDSGQRLSILGSPGPEAGQVALVLAPGDGAGDAEAAEGFRRHLAWLNGLAAGMAHEIRNPLGGIRGAAQLLRRKPGTVEWDELTALIIQESDRIGRLVQRLMDLCRPRALRPSRVALPALVHEEVATLRAIRGLRRGDGASKPDGDPIAWDLDLDPSLPAVEGDAERLREAVGNLLRNAMDAARSRVVVRARVDPEGRLREPGFDRGLTLRIDVEDDGPGIDPDFASQLFAPFVTNKPHGTGLGLFVARLAIEDHRGLLQVDPRPGEGARFSVVLSERLPGSNPDAVLGSAERSPGPAARMESR